MKNQNIQTKRGTGKKASSGILHARTRGRKKQRASIAGTPEDLNGDVPNVGIGRVLMVILVVHIVAIGAIITHNMIRERNGLGVVDEEVVIESDTVVSEKVAKVAKAPVMDQPQVRKENAVSEAKKVEAPVGHNTIPSFATEEPTQNPLLDEVIPKAVVVSPNRRPSEQIQYKSYTVKSGDSAWRIATENKMSVADLLRINGKKTSAIKVGEVLKVK